MTGLTRKIDFMFWLSIVKETVSSQTLSAESVSDP